MSLIVMVCYARSGGTMLNRCLGSLPNVVIMSEVNPMGGGTGYMPKRLTTVKAQAKDWYGIDLKSEDFTESLLELYEYCNKNGKHLILRDWPFINFVPFRLNEYNAPEKFLVLEELKGKVDVKPFAFIRDSIDSWISQGARKPRKYFPHYNKYVKEVVKQEMPIFKYEDFCSDPEKVMKDICKETGLEYSDSFKNYEYFTTVNGDPLSGNCSRGVRQRIIKPLLRKRVTLRRVFQVNNDKNMIEANKIFNYYTNYYASELESFSLTKSVKRFISNFRF